jgi:hypothetical protein
VINGFFKSLVHMCGRQHVWWVSYQNNSSQIRANLSFLEANPLVFFVAHHFACKKLCCAK